MGNEIYLGADLPPLPEELLLARDRGEVLFIVGAGASFRPPSSLPSFKGLVADIYRTVDSAMAVAIDEVLRTDGLSWDAVAQPLDHRQRTELKFFCQGEYDVVLGMLERRIDDDASRQSRLRCAVLDALQGSSEPNPIHHALVRLGQRFGQTLLVTSNFDRLLTEAAKRLRLSHETSALGEIPKPSRGSQFNGILHIHGKLPSNKERGSDLILTDQDFGDAYLRRHTITSFLYDAARIFHLVLVGYSANDSPVRYLLNAIASDERHFSDLKPRYAFIGCDPTDERTPIEWHSRGITPIPYNRASNHQTLEDILVKWANLIPDNRNKIAIRKYLTELARVDPDKPEAAAAKSFIRYYFKRSTPTERAELFSLFAGNRVSPRWLGTLNRFIRETTRTR